jgi:hypothetical protein
MTVARLMTASDVAAFLYGNIPGADTKGVADSTAALQAAVTAAAGGVLNIPLGDYLISSPIVIPSNTHVIGQGKGTRLFTAAQIGFSFFENTNLSVHGDSGSYGVALDTGIIIEEIFFDYGTLNDGHTHAIGFRLAENCTVQRCWFNGGNDGTAWLASKNMTVRDCVATGCTNVAYDHWDGVENCLVENCVAVMHTATSVNDNAGIMFSAANTGVDIRITKGCIARGNKIYNAGIGVFINQLDTIASETRHCTVADNQFYSCLAGVYATGAGFGHHILNNYVEGGGAADGSLIRIAGEPGTANPSDCRVQGTVARGFVGTGVNTGLFDVSGLRHIFGDLTLVNGSGINGGVVYAIKSAASGCVIEGAQMLDASSISATSFGLFVGNKGSPSDTNCAIRCWNGFASAWKDVTPA